MGGGTKAHFLKVLKPCVEEVTLSPEELAKRGIDQLGIDGNALVYTTVPDNMKKNYVQADSDDEKKLIAAQIAAKVRDTVESIRRKTGVPTLTVFDGKDLPEKSIVDAERRRLRKAALAAEKYAEAFECTPELVGECSRVLNGTRKHSALTAAYEADHQLAWLYFNKKIGAVLADDTDFLLFPVPLLRMRKAEGLSGNSKKPITTEFIDLQKTYLKARELERVLPQTPPNACQGVIRMWKWSSEADRGLGGGYGFIKCNDADKNKLPEEAKGKDLFFHARDVKQGGFKNSGVGVPVEFVVEESKRAPKKKRDSPFVGVRVTGIGGRDVAKSLKHYDREQKSGHNKFAFQREFATAIMLTGNDYNNAHIDGCGLEMVLQNLSDALWDPIRFANIMRSKKKSVPRGFIPGIKRALWLVQHGPVFDDDGDVVPLSGDPTVRAKDRLFAETGHLNCGNADAAADGAAGGSGGSPPPPQGWPRSGKGKGKGKYGGGKKGKRQGNQGA